ncbi:MAG: DNA-directed DNA polymerase I [Candidatus Nezhaarchaeales archaeon]
MDAFKEDLEEAEEEAVEEEVIAETVFEAEKPENTGTCYLLSVSYNGRVGKALIKLYDPEKGKIYFWYDNTGHKPYCLTNASIDELRVNPAIIGYEGYDHLEAVKKYDPLKDEEVTMTKIVVNNPLAIGGGPKGGIRELLPAAWEARVKYHNCYIYDAGLIPGMPYRVKDGKLVPEGWGLNIDTPSPIKGELQDELVKEWFMVLQQPAPDIRRAAIDIEVASPAIDRVPNPSEAEYPIISVAIASSDGLNKVLLLKRGEEELKEKALNGVRLELLEDERKLIEETFKVLNDYPLILTFNGDNFDLRYLRNRAQKLGFPKASIPIVLGKDTALLPIGVHVDLYKFFHNKSVQVYAFGGKYREVTLDSISEALLGYKKIAIDKLVSELTYEELATYCYRDAKLVLDLTTFQNSLLIKLIVMFMRISKLPMEDVTRQGISGWIKNLLQFEHRRRNYLIPRPEDILTSKGGAATKALIKGKKYMGAIVLEPKPGAYFNITVLDFTSLYPSILKTRNLSYEVINCPHKECRSNIIAGTPHWVCVKRRGLTSTIIGMLRDFRAYWFKPKSKDKSLSQEVRSWYSVVERSLKVILNASYGVMGHENFPLYCPPAAEAVTAVGRYIISRTIDKAKELGLEVIYGDTDSIFVLNPREEDVEKLAAWVEEELRVDLDVDKKYRYVAFPKLKKNYLGVLEDGSVEIKGMVGKKRNTPEFLKIAFSELIGILASVHSQDEFVQAKEKIRSIVRDCYSRLKGRKYTLDDLAFKVMLSKSPKHYVKTTPQHVKAAQQLANIGKRVEAGDIIAFVKVKGPIGVKPLPLARIDEVDVDKYIGHLRTTFEQVLEALGIGFDEVLGLKRLESFF